MRYDHYRDDCNEMFDARRVFIKGLTLLFIGALVATFAIYTINTF